MSDLRATVLATARSMNGAGMNRGTAGNVSARHADGFFVTPTGMDYDESEPEDIVFMGLDGRIEGRRKPSSEWRFHRDIYAERLEAGAIIHTHAPFATALACRGEAIPPFHYMIARFGGADIRCAPYATFGTQELSDRMLVALEGRTACLMAHHGMVACGGNLKRALALAIEFETLCEQYWRALTLGPVTLLDDGEMQRVVQKFKDYGRQD